MASAPRRTARIQFCGRCEDVSFGYAGTGAARNVRLQLEQRLHMGHISRGRPAPSACSMGRDRTHMRVLRRSRAYADRPDTQEVQAGRRGTCTRTGGTRAPRGLSPSPTWGGPTIGVRASAQRGGGGLL
eukprot:72486-Prymnesium_polylepis.2